MNVKLKCPYCGNKDSFNMQHSEHFSCIARFGRWPTPVGWKSCFPPMVCKRCRRVGPWEDFEQTQPLEGLENGNKKRDVHSG